LTAARRWLRVEMLLCRSASSQSRNTVIASASMRSRVSLSGGMDLQSRNQARCEVRKRCSNTAKSVAITGAFRDGWDDVAVGTLDAGGDVRVGLGGQPQVVVGVGDGGVAHVGLKDRQQRGNVLAAGEPRPKI